MFALCTRPLILRKSVRTFKNASFLKVELGPEDPILGLSVAFQADPDPKKVNLGVGAYRGEDGKPYVLRCVRAAEHSLVGKLDHEYLPIAGLDSFVRAAQTLLFGEDSAPATEKRLASVQTISGTGALRIAAEFLARHFTGEKKIYLPAQTWGNHRTIFTDAGIALGSYRYYKPDTRGLDFEGMLADISQIPAGSMVLFHACAHNPTGVDPTPAQWDKIISACRKNGLYPIIDSAYQGFASGDPNRDAETVRKFVTSGPAVVTQSFAKNFGLYGQRVGALHIVTEGAEETKAVMSQLKIIIRPMYSTPPIHGARLVSGPLAAYGAAVAAACVL